MVEDVAFYEFESVGEEFVTGREIVEDDDLVAGAAESSRGMTADVSRTADDENDHVVSFLLREIVIVHSRGVQESAVSRQAFEC